MMVIIFYDANNEKLFICTEHEKTKIIDADSPDVMDYIPNDDILYVSNGHFVTKEQFRRWLSGEMELVETPKQPHSYNGFLSSQFQPPGEAPAVPNSQRLYLHTTFPGVVIVPDIKTEKFPDGLQFFNKWQFIPLDEIGDDVIKNSRFLQGFIKQGKLAVVPEEYVRKNQHKARQDISPREQELNSILIPADVRAHEAASAGGIHALDRDRHSRDSMVWAGEVR